MNFIFSTLIVILIVLLFTIFAAWIGKFNAKHKVAFIEKTLDRKEAFIDNAIEKVLDKVSTTVTSGIDMAMDQHKTGPWYLAVYAKDSNYPIWVSNNTIRSVHPDPELCNIIVKQFNGEDMVIDNVEYYDMCAANDLCDYDM